MNEVSGTSVKSEDCNACASAVNPVATPAPRAGNAVKLQSHSGSVGNSMAMTDGYQESPFMSQIPSSSPNKCPPVSDWKYPPLIPMPMPISDPYPADADPAPPLPFAEAPEVTIP